VHVDDRVALHLLLHARHAERLAGVHRDRARTPSQDPVRTIGRVSPSDHTLRYSGASIGYQLASLTAGGPAPLIALYLFNKFGTSMAVAAYVSVTAMVSLVCVYLLKDADPALDHQ
jgi:hypothetical protein